MLPPEITIVDDDPALRHALEHHFAAQGVRVEASAAGEALPADAVVRAAPPWPFYLLGLGPAADVGESLVRSLRERSQAGIVVLAGDSMPQTFERLLAAGADMCLVKPATLGQITQAARAVYRRVAGLEAAAAATDREHGRNGRTWRLDPAQRRLTSPEGTAVELGTTDVELLACFAANGGAVISHAEINTRLGRPQRELPDNSLHALIYRLRRRVDRVTGGLLPLQAQSRLGYVFKAPIRIVDGTD